MPGTRRENSAYLRKMTAGKTATARTSISHSRLLRLSQPVKCKTRMTIAKA